ncbi:MAG: GntR family transcriptional regulator [Lachnospiraceae bacterium]|nr:GntR family transcriptional regulator [Lachnospiraceae bacterium]
MSIREKAYILLRDAIIDGTLKQGERMVEDNLAIQYSVSRTPLREAIHKLELDGFLQRLPSRGLVVAELSIKEAEELYQVRGYLEGLAARTFTENMTSDKKNIIETYRKNVILYHDNGSVEEVLEACRQQHNYIRENCGHKICSEYIQKMDLHIARYRRLGVRESGRTEQAYLEHLTILDDILKENADAAEDTMRNHIIVSGKAVIDAIGRNLQTVN